MAYEVTATRRRPQQFADLAGQEFVAETLKNSIKTKQIAHAYLFAGPRGCGKTSSARILAKALNCQNSDGPTCEPCGQCESCKAITNSSSLDVIEIDGASNTSVNDVRQIKDEVMFPPTSCRYKIYIIDEVHMLSTSAFNALLKTIEEPPAHVIFIFATTELQKVPATIKSRCQQYNFRLVSTEKLKSLLSDACSELNIQADDEALYWVAKESGGSVRDCYTLFDQVAAFSQGHITYDKIRDKLGLLGVDRLNSIFESCVSGDANSVMNQLDEFLQSGISIEQLISNSTDYLRSLLLIKNGITKEGLLGQSKERYSVNVLNGWNTVQTERAVSIFLQLYRDIRYSISPRYELELAFSRLCWLSQYVSPSEVKAAIDKAQSLLLGAGGTNVQSIQAPAVSAKSAEHAATPQVKEMQSSTANPVTQESIPEQPADVQNTQNQTNSEQGATNVPNGMPLFSALQKDKEKANPFYNGGAVPPKTTAAESSNNIPPQNKQSDFAGYVMSDDEGIEDDWSNTANPEDDFSPEEEIELQNEFAESYQEQITPPEEQSEDIHKSQESFVTSDGNSIPLEKIYAKTVSDLSVSNPLISSALMQTQQWHISGNKISTTIKSEYQKKQIDSNKEQICSILSLICGCKMDFEIQFIPEIKVETKVEIPDSVRILCSAFKGNIVGGKQ